MNYKPLQIGDLIAERPIVQGGMGVGISLGNLAGAVAKEGGVGIISSAQIGFKEEDFENNPRLANKKAIKKEYEKARRISPNGIIGFNIMVALKDYREHVIEVAKAGADIIVGHHPHIIQPIEIYKGKYIIYSIGNFILPQTVYPDKKLIFKDSYIQYELIIEWDGVEVKIHTLHYDYCNNKLMINYDFPMRKLFHLFQQQMQRSEYKKIFLSHSSFVDIIFRMRFWDSYIGEVVSFISRKIFRIIRKIIIFVGLHKPYNC